MKTVRGTGFELADQRFKEMRSLIEEFEELERENAKQEEIRKKKEKESQNKRR